MKSKSTKKEMDELLDSIVATTNRMDERLDAIIEILASMEKTINDAKAKSKK